MRTWQAGRQMLFGTLIWYRVASARRAKGGASSAGLTEALLVRYWDLRPP